VAPDRPGAQQARPTGLLVDAGMPDDGRHTEDRGGEHEVEKVDAGDHPRHGEVVVTVAGPADEHGHRVAEDRGEGSELGTVVGDDRDRHGEVQGEHRHARHPQWQAEPVTAQLKPQDGTGAGDRGHASARPSSARP